VRIIAGQWRGRKLVAPPGDATRPTADRVREALFSMLTSRLGSFEGLRVADVFAGSGALGLEALSRGAAHCTFVEHDRQALTALRANIAALGAAADVLAVPALSVSRTGVSVDLLLLDPPYASDDALKSVAVLGERGWIGPATLVSLETGTALAEIDGFAVETARRIGKAHITLIRQTR